VGWVLPKAVFASRAVIGHGIKAIGVLAKPIGSHHQITALHFSAQKSDQLPGVALALDASRILHTPALHVLSLRQSQRDVMQRTRPVLVAGIL
jgi:hypothetical protein